MKVAISATSKFHSFDLAREMYNRGALAGIYTGYPRFKLKGEQIPQELIHTFPYIHATKMALSKIGESWFGGGWEFLNFSTFDRHVAHRLPACDVFVGQSGSSLHTGRLAKRQGIRFVCDRGPAHIRTQDQLLREEHERWGVPYVGIDARVIDREESEYAEADLITVPSRFALESFLNQGISARKLRLLPYGVSLSRFFPVANPSPDTFEVLFVGNLSLQKGIPYLLQAFSQVQHRSKRLTLCGSADSKFLKTLHDLGLKLDHVNIIGHVAQENLKNLMSRSHVVVLPSIQDGFGLVLAEAMACACPVIGTHNTGASDAINEAVDGFVVRTRDADALAEKLQYLSDNPQVRAAMGMAAQQNVTRRGGWKSYGDSALLVYQDSLHEPAHEGETSATSNALFAAQPPILLFESHPIQYKAPVYQKLENLMPNCCEVVYATDATLRPNNYDVEFGKTFSWDTPLLEGYRFTVLGNETRFPLSGSGSLSGRGVFALLKKRRPKAIILNSLHYHFDFAAYLSALLLGIPLLIRQETQDEMYAARRGRALSIIRTAIYRIAYFPVRRAYAYGLLNYEHLRRHGIAPSRISLARFSVVNHLDGVGEDERRVFRNRTREEYAIHPEKLVIGFFGKFIDKKHPTLLFDVLQLIPSNLRQRIHFLYVGAGELEVRLRDRAQEAKEKWGIDTSFAGFVNQSELPRYYLATDLLVLPSRRMGEAWGLVVNEALNAGCSVAISDAVGCYPEFCDLERVRVFDEGSAEELARAITDLSIYPRDFRWAENRMRNYSSIEAARGIKSGLIAEGLVAS